MVNRTPADCLIVGGGPAGLTAAIYAARFRLRTLVVDAGLSRAALIPCTRNQAGFPEGISGVELLGRMRQQAKNWGAEIVSGEVANLECQSDTLAAVVAGGDRIEARAVILATGVSNHRPEISEEIHATALARGYIRYCPVCDGFEVTDKDVAVIGVGARAVREATFLRAYTRRVTVITPTADPFEPELTAQMTELGIASLLGPPRDFRIDHSGLTFEVDGHRVGFDSVYPSLGSTSHSELAAQLGAELTDEGCIRVDAHQRTSVPRLYAAGDVVVGLDQISHAMGEAGVAATTLRNDLAAATPLLR